MGSDDGAGNTSKTTRVLIAGPAGRTNAALAELLGEFEYIDVIGMETQITRALIQTAALQPDVVLLDLDSRIALAMASVSLFREITPPPEIILLAQGVTDVIRQRGMEAGVRLVFEKSGDLEMLVRALAGLTK